MHLKITDHLTRLGARPLARVPRLLLAPHLAVVPARRYGGKRGAKLAELPPGVRSGRHTHPGTVVANIQEGVLTLDYEGRPTATYKAGDVVFVEAGKIHEDINNGTTPIKLIAAYVVEKGKPLTSPAP